MSWTMPIQPASYRGVKFNVLSVSDSFDRTIAEHAYPFINGADLEDMGLNPRVVQMQAVFFGEGYYIELKKLLNALQQQGADVLVHPILGRMPNMLCYSAAIKHEADYINYCTLDLSFKEASEMQPIFVFESALIARLDRALSQLEDLLLTTDSFYLSLMETIAFGLNVKTRLLNMWRGVSGVYQALKSLCSHTTLAQVSYSLPAGVVKQDFAEKNQLAFKAMQQLITADIESLKQQAHLTPQARFNETVRRLESFMQLPRLVLSGQEQTPSYQALQAQQTLGQAVHLGASRLSAEDISLLNIGLKLFCVQKLAQFTLDLIEQDMDAAASMDTLTPSEIEQYTGKVRGYLLSLLNELRALQVADNQKWMINIQAVNTDIYTGVYQVEESLRNLAAALLAVAQNAINRKPPLSVKEAPISGTIHQIAHLFYQDYRRAEELLRLNPNLHKPHFVEQGVLLNAYSQ